MVKELFYQPDRFQPSSCTEGLSMQINNIKTIVGVMVGFILGIVAGMYLMNYIVDKSNLSAYDAALVAANNALSKNEENEAMGYLYEAIARNRQRYSAYSMLGDIYLRRKEKDQAIRMYQMALENMNRPQRSWLFGTLDNRVIGHDKQIIERKISGLK